jgi:hypothetical protein
VARRLVRPYHASVVFRAPLPFVFAWCTDYTADDPKYAGEDRTIHLQRRIVERTARRVVFENLYDEGLGWAWERHVVTLRPPHRWHCDGRGSYFDVHLDYRLTALPGDRTKFEMEWSSSPNGSFRGRCPSRRAVEQWVEHLWGLRGRALEQEYRKSVGRGASAGRGVPGATVRATPEKESRRREASPSASGRRAGTRRRT